MDVLDNLTEVKDNVIYEKGHIRLLTLWAITEDDGNKWLMFIQISLQFYQDHKKKLFELFKRNDKNRSWYNSTTAAATLIPLH